MKTVAISVVVLLIGYVSYASLEEYPKWADDHFRNSTNGTNCTSPGFACGNCLQQIFCEPNENGTFTEYPAELCRTGETCLKGNCTSDPNPYCPAEKEPDFICRTPGMYPDPFNCKKYHYCVQTKNENGTSNSTSNSNSTVLLEYTAECECDYGYNPRTNFCDIKLENKKCFDRIALTCFIYAQSYSLWENPSLYYVCLYHPDNGKLYPFLYACEHGKIYDGSTRLCK